MKKAIIPVCILLATHCAYGQRNQQFDAKDRLFVEGRELFILKNYPGCLDKLEAYKEDASNQDLIQEADFLIAAVAYEQGSEEALSLLNEFMDNYPTTPHRDELLFMIGSCHFAEENYQKAAFWYDQSNVANLSSEQQQEYCFRLAYSLLQTKKIDQSRHYFELLKRNSKKYEETATYYLGYIDYAKGNYKSALATMNKLKNDKVFGEQALYYIAQINFLEGKYEQAISEAKKLLKAYPDSKNNSEMNRVIGNSYYMLNAPDQAITYLEKYASAVDSPLRSDMYILGVCLFNRQDYSDAIKWLGRVVNKQDEVTQSAYLYLGQSYLKLKDKNNARMAFEMASKQNYDKAAKEAALYNYALLIHETAFSGFGESVTIFEEFVNNYPNSQYIDKVNDYLVEVYLTTKNYQAALNSINKIKNPSNKILAAKQSMLFHLGTQDFTNRDYQQAVNYFNQAIAMGNLGDDIRSNAYFWRGESHYRMNEFARAADDFKAYLNTATKRNTQMYALGQYNLGYAFFKLKRYNEALEYFRRYVNQETDQSLTSVADAYNRIGDCLFNNRQFAEAETYYSKAAALQPKANDYAMYQKGFLLGLQKDYTQKIQVMDKLLRDYPQSQYVDDALFEKGRAYVMLEKPNDAISTFDQLMQRFPQSVLSRKAGVQLGLIYFNENQLEKASAAYRNVINKYPGSDEAKTALQDLKAVYLDLNDIDGYANYVKSLGGAAQFEVGEQDSLTYLAAEKQFLKGETKSAERSLINYLQNYPSGAFAPNANFYLGSIYFAEKQYPEARAKFMQVINSGDMKYMEGAYARLAEMDYLNKEYDKALMNFKKLQEVANDKDNIDAAKLGIMRCSEILGNNKEAIEAANNLLQDPKLSPELIAEARFVRAKAYIATKQTTKAIEDLKAVSKNTRTVYGAEAKYLLAQVYFDSKQTDKAEKELMNFIETGTPHQYWLARGFILLADIYISKGDDFQARQYLESLKNNYKGNDEISDMIQNRLSKLKN